MTPITSLLSAAIIAGSLIAPAAVSTATPTEGATELTLEIVPTTTGVVAPGEGLSLSVTVQNSTGEPRPASTVVVTLDRAASTDRDALVEDLQSPTAQPSFASAEIARIDMPALEATATLELPPIVVEPDALSAITSDSFGAHVVSAEAISEDGSLGSVASLVTISPGDVVTDSSLALALPVTVPVTSSGVLDAETLTSYTAPGGLLSNQLDETVGRPVALGIDPRIIASIRVLGEDAPPSATAWLDRLEESNNETFALAYGDSDISATSQAGAGVLAPVGFDVDPTRFDGVPAATPGPTTGPTGDPAPVPSAAPSLSPDGVTVPSTESLLEWGYTAEGIAWPRESTVVQGDLPTFATAGFTTTIVDSGSVVPADDASAPIASSVRLGENTAMVSDALVSGLMREAVGASTDGEWRAAMARLTGALATLAADAPAGANIVLATFDRNSGLGVYRVGETVDALSALPWLQSSTIDSARAAPPAAATLLESPVDDERLARIAELAAADSSVTQFATVLEDPLALTADSRLGFLALASQEWATDLTASAWPSAIESFVARSAETVASVQLASTTDFVLAADNAALPIPIVNELDQPATVFVTVRPQTGILDVQDSLVEITVPAGSQTRALVPVRSVANGQVLVNISLASAAGVPIGSPTAVEVDVRAGWDTAVTTVLFILVVLVFVLGIVRTIRRTRARRRSAAETTPVAEGVES